LGWHLIAETFHPVGEDFVEAVAGFVGGEVLVEGFLGWEPVWDRGCGGGFVGRVDGEERAAEGEGDRARGVVGGGVLCGGGFCVCVEFEQVGIEFEKAE